MPLQIATSLTREYDPTRESAIIQRCLEGLAYHGYAELAQNLDAARKRGDENIDNLIERKYQELVLSHDPLYTSLYASVPKDIPDDAPNPYREHIATAAMVFDEINLWGELHRDQVPLRVTRAMESIKHRRDIHNVIDNIRRLYLDSK